MRRPPTIQVWPDQPSKTLRRLDVSSQEVARGKGRLEVGLAPHELKREVREITTSHLVVILTTRAADLRARRLGENKGDRRSTNSPGPRRPHSARQSVPLRPGARARPLTFEGRRHYTAFLTNRQLYRYLAALGGGRYPSSRASRGTNPGFPGSRERPRQSDATARTSIWREPRSDTTGDPDGAVRRRTPAYRAGCFCLWWKK